MIIKQAKNPESCPKTRRALLSHLWGKGIKCNVFKEGAFYAITVNGIIAATHRRRIDNFSFSNWEKEVLFIQSIKK